MEMVHNTRTDEKKKRTLQVLCGGRIPEKVPPALELIARSIETPKEMYLHLEDIVNDPHIRDLRLHLARVQVDSEVHMRDDVDYHTQRLWVAQTIERMVFGGLMVEGEKIGKGEDGDD